MGAGRVVHQCGCTSAVTHSHGSVVVTCQGSPGRTPEGVISIKPEHMKPCPGRLRYEVVAVRTVRYDSRPLGGGSAA